MAKQRAAEPNRVPTYSDSPAVCADHARTLDIIALPRLIIRRAIGRQLKSVRVPVIRFIGPMYRVAPRRAAPSIDFSSRGVYGRARTAVKDVRFVIPVENSRIAIGENTRAIPSSGFRFPRLAPPPELTDLASNNLLIRLAALDENYK